MRDSSFNCRAHSVHSQRDQQSLLYSTQIGQLTSGLLERNSDAGTIAMFVGHFAIAFLLWRLFPQVPLPVVLIAVSFPDLLWSLLVPAGIEKVRINPDSPLQKFVVFEKFPYSHSLVLGSVLSLPIGLLIAALLNNPVIVPVFVAERPHRVRRRIRLLHDRHSFCSIRTPISVRADPGSSLSCYQSAIVLWAQ